ncbi:acetyltransferase [Xylariales sp. AK1849]|nr:acetyltransferase [Xylariales sp. AK1849]
MASSHFNIRETTTPDDADFIVSAFDSTIPHLEGIGSGAQWGAQPFSQRKDTFKDCHDWVDKSEAYRLRPDSTTDGKIRVFIGEVPVPVHSPPAADDETGDDATKERNDDGLSRRVDADTGVAYLRVGALVLRDAWFAPYVADQPQFAHLVNDTAVKEGSVYVYGLVSDFRTGEARKGVGAALVTTAREYALSKGAGTLFLDCWGGNAGRLVRFYESVGFTPVDDFFVNRKDKEPWPGKLLRMDLS